MVLCGPQPPSLLDARGLVTPTYIQSHADNSSSSGAGLGRASYGATGPNGYPVQAGVPPSLAQLQRHMMGPLPSDDQLSEIKIGDPESDNLKGETIKKSVSNNTLSSRNLSLHDGVAGDPAPDLDLDQTTMIGSALDLDSLDGEGREDAGGANSNSNNGSQVGLLKLSAV